MTIAVSASALTVTYPEVVALDDVTFSVPAGTSTALVGSNGSGKTTLLDAIAGLRSPTAGQLTVAAEPAFVRQRTGGPRWLPLTVLEVVRMGRYRARGPFGRMVKSDREAIAAAAARLEIDALLPRQFGELSGGQQQRALVAQALVQGSELLLLDEPVTGLDLASQRRIMAVIAEECGAGRTVVFSTHHLEEARRADQVLLLAGHLVASGAPADVLTTANLRAAYGTRLLDTH